MFSQVTNRLEFDEEKAIEALLLISNKNKDLISILKIIYLADKKHLNLYGNSMFGECYARLEHGVTASNSYDILKGIKGEGNDEYQQRYSNSISVSGTNVTPLRDANLKYLSKSDVECLNEAINDWNRLTFNEKVEIVHDETYKANKEHLISTRDFLLGLENKDKLIDHLTTTFI